LKNKNAPARGESEARIVVTILVISSASPTPSLRPTTERMSSSVAAELEVKAPFKRW
jgi:hypothetical protein